MYCPKCSTNNSEGRRFCGECGTLIILFCRKCGFVNSLSDKYCGGCGTSLLDLDIKGSNEEISSQEPCDSSGKYSADDLRELIDDRSQKSEKKPKKKDIKESGEVSQDILDSMFSSDNSKKEEKDD